MLTFYNVICAICCRIHKSMYSIDLLNIYTMHFMNTPKYHEGKTREWVQGLATLACCARGKWALLLSVLCQTGMLCTVWRAPDFRAT